MDDEATLSKIDMWAAFNGKMAESIYLLVNGKPRKRRDGDVTRWDVNSSALHKIISHHAILQQALQSNCSENISPSKPLIIPFLLC